MKTTIDIPDELFRQAKARAALDGVPLREIVEEGLRLALKLPREPKRTRIKLPLIRSAKPGSVNASDIRKAEEAAALAEDLAHARPRRR